VSLFRRITLSRFDMLALATMLGLVIVIALTTAASDSSVPGLRVAFLKTGDDGVQNLWLADPSRVGDLRPLTAVGSGNRIIDFDPAPDGRTIAYTVYDFDADSQEIYLIDLRNGSTQQITQCKGQDADCSSPVWRPDGAALAYQRVELNSALDLGVSPNRIWLLEMDTGSTYPIINDPQVLGYDARWSEDGSKLAFYDAASGGIVIYNFASSEVAGETQLAYVPSLYGTVGHFSPDGSQFVYAEMSTGGPIAHAYLQLAGLEDGQTIEISAPEEETDDSDAVWHPDGERLAIRRRYLTGDDYTRGHQLYLMTVETSQLVPLIVDARYNHGLFSWSPDGGQLVVQRFQIFDDAGQAIPDSRTQIWTYELATGALTLIADDAFIPRWVPALEP